MPSTALMLAQEVALASPHIADRIEAETILEPQAENPIFHHFGPGVYIREAHLPQLTLVVGHRHRQATLNVFLSGELLLMEDDGSTKALKAPLIFTSPPGRKTALTVTDCVWLNIWATDETDIQKLEDMFIERSQVQILAEEQRLAAESAEREADRQDFLLFCKEINMTPDQVQAMSENTSDYMHQNYPNLSIRRSAIQGLGVFASSTIQENTTIGQARVRGKRTPLGRYVNHSRTPNAYYVQDQIGDIYLVAKRTIEGTRGPSFGEEVTVDYRQAYAISRGVQP